MIRRLLNWSGAIRYMIGVKMGAIPPQIPGQGKEDVFGAGFWLAILFVAIAALPSAGVAWMLVEIVYPGAR